MKEYTICRKLNLQYIEISIDKYEYNIFDWKVILIVRKLNLEYVEISIDKYE